MNSFITLWNCIGALIRTNTVYTQENFRGFKNQDGQIWAVLWGTWVPPIRQTVLCTVPAEFQTCLLQLQSYFEIMQFLDMATLNKMYRHFGHSRKIALWKIHLPFHLCYEVYLQLSCQTQVNSLSSQCTVHAAPTISSLFPLSFGVLQPAKSIFFTKGLIIKHTQIKLALSIDERCNKNFVVFFYRVSRLLKNVFFSGSAARLLIA